MLAIPCVAAFMPAMVPMAHGPRLDSVTRELPTRNPPVVSAVAAPFMTATLRHVPPRLRPRASGPAMMGLAATAMAAEVARTRIRLEGYSSYSVVAALVLNAALRLLTSTDLDLNKLAPIGKIAPSDRLLQCLFLASISVCVLGGSYVCLVFALCATYAKTALGYGLDAQCMAFLAATSRFRVSAFYSFVAMLAAFIVTFPLSIFFKIVRRVRRDRSRPPFTPSQLARSPTSVLACHSTHACVPSRVWHVSAAQGGGGADRP